MNRMIRLCILFFSLAAAGAQAQDTPGSPADAAFVLNFDAIADKLAERMDLQDKEHIVFVGAPGRFEPFIRILREKVRARGAVDLGVISVTGEQPPVWSTDFTAGIAGLSREQMPNYLSAVDLGVMLPGATPDDDVYAAIQDVLKRNSGRTIHFHWAGAYSIDNRVLDSSPRIDAVYQDAVLQTDYPALSHRQEAFEAAARGRTIRVTTPAGTDLQFDIGDRPVTRQNGDASAARAKNAQNLIDREIEFPSGAIRVAPIEQSVHGTIVFPDMRWNGNLVRGLWMKFEHGKVVAFNSETNLAAVKAELDHAGEAGKSFREFALGMNPLLAVQNDPEPWIPCYGYGSGVVRLSLGDNTELGGKVGGSYVRWNFFTDTTVTVGDEVWVELGKAVR